MYLTYFDKRRPLFPNVGLPMDFKATTVTDWSLRDIAKLDDVKLLVDRDNMPIPDTRDRENYSGDNHLDYWLSGYASTLQLAEAYPQLLTGSGLRILDFGGATGRVSRHITLINPSIEVWLSDINVNWISWVDQYFNRPIKAFQNRPFPAMPIEDNYFDLIFAFSVFTHLDTDEMPWLLEMRRMLRPGGMLFATVLDDEVWSSLRNPGREWLKRSLQRGRPDDAFLSAIESGGIPDDRYVLTYSNVEAYNLNIFLGRSWIQRKWGALFSSLRFGNSRADRVPSEVIMIK